MTPKPPPPDPRPAEEHDELEEAALRTLERLHDLIASGRAEEALAEAEAGLDADPQDGSLALVRAFALAELGDLESAYEEVTALVEDFPEDGQLHGYLAQFAFDTCDFAAARRAAERSLKLEPTSATATYLLGLLAERDGDLDAADRRFLRAHELDAEAFPPPLHLSDEEFSNVVEQAMGELPAQFRALLVDVAIIEDPVPQLSILESMGADADPGLLGLYTGPSLQEESVFDGITMPRTVHLFRRNIDRAGRTVEEIAEQVRITLYHEIGHHLGYDEHGVAELGLE